MQSALEPSVSAADAEASGVMCWNFDDEKINRAAVFITDCSRDKRCDEMPTSVALP